MAWHDQYRGRVVLISGASLGIGKELARQVWTLGGMVIAMGRNAERLEEGPNTFAVVLMLRPEGASSP